MLKRLFRRNARPAKVNVGSVPGDPSGAAAILRLHLKEPGPWVGHYPDVPPPEQRLSLEMFVARFVCGDIYGEDTPEMAADLLEAGYDTPSLRRLAGEMQVHDRADASAYIDRIAREAGLPVPFPLRQAQMLVTQHIARKVIAGQLDPWRAVGDFEETWGWRTDPQQSDIRLILAAADEFIWDQEAQRYRPVVDQDLVDAFARLARLGDEACLAANETPIPGPENRRRVDPVV
jgi:hypothetical protein